MAKIYTVVKDGEELETLKTLAAAKKLADSEGAEVYSDGKCVYQGTVETSVEPVDMTPVETVEEPVKEEPVAEIVTAEPVVAEKPKQPIVEEPKVEMYRLKSLMNIRKKPSMNAQILGTRARGTVVRVLGVENGWLHLADDTFILYQSGRFAEKI